ncbi:SlyX family protein [Methylococcus mesophilus]|uniref:SlyX family protein n=1 Tax=Methylococcus mesophilus TaxID=2993564 RepID=UPI00224B6BD8|nr:SlyX family protein [Methylococcus mesophilus]UZR27862.1 SlyX family protein [Methylococcus mesophilus]
MAVESEARLVDIETKLAYLEDTVLALNDVVTRQQKQIDQFETKIRLLVERVQQMSILAETAAPAADEKPPHY